MRIRYLALVCIILLCWLLFRPHARPVFHSGGTLLTFVIDAGHGGEDGGAVGSGGRKESDINLAVARKTDLLFGLCGIPAVMTRTSDEIAYPDAAVTIRQRKTADMEYRAAVVNSRERAVLLSIHQNKFTSAGPRGAQVFYGKGEGSRELAVCVQSRLAVLCGEHRKAAPISEEVYLMRQAACPAILVECGFLSNPEEMELLIDDEYQTKLAAALTAGCIGQLKELERVYGEG